MQLFLSLYLLQVKKQTNKQKEACLNSYGKPGSGVFPKFQGLTPKWVTTVPLSCKPRSKSSKLSQVALTSNKVSKSWKMH